MFEDVEHGEPIESFEKIKKKPKRPPQVIAKKRIERQEVRAFLRHNREKFPTPKNSIKHVISNLGNWEKGETP